MSSKRPASTDDEDKTSKKRNRISPDASNKTNCANQENKAPGHHVKVGGLKLNMFVDDREYYSLKKAAKYLGETPTTRMEHSLKGIGPKTYFAGSERKFLADDVRAYSEQRKRGRSS
jgi:hypothetical protein